MEIAIVGLGCRFPGASDPIGYWELIRSGTVTFRPIPASRWDHARVHDKRSGPGQRPPISAYERLAQLAGMDEPEVLEKGLTLEPEE